MRTFSSLLLLTASSVLATAQDAARTTPAAQLTRRGTEGCADPKAVARCVSAMQAYIAKCSDDNWDCKCSGAANIANCYVDCVDNPDAESARSLSAGTCATANAYDDGLTIVPPVRVTPTSNAADLAVPTAIPTGSAPGEEEAAVATSTQEAQATEKKESAKPSEGAAPGKVAAGWFAVAGLGLGALL